MTIKTTTIPDWTKEIHPQPTLYLKKLFLAVAFAKMNEYKRQTEVFENKCKMSFAQFKKKIQSQKKEDFSQWDDFMLWEGLNGAYLKWQKRYQELSRYV